MHTKPMCFFSTIILGFGLAGGALAQTPQPIKVDSETISGLGARNIGSAAMSGRVAAIAGVQEGQRLTVYVGAASGGVWKSVNGGSTFKPIFDKQPVQSIGAITIDPKNPKVIWVGTGEAWTRNSTSVGDGLYKSIDGGDNWTNMGLKESERIAKILVDPTNTNTVYVAVPGKLWSDSDERGVYKTTDGGKTWNRILKGANASTGCSMISMDPQNPQTIYAGLWDFRRKGWTFRSGGAAAAVCSRAPTVALRGLNSRRRVQRVCRRNRGAASRWQLLLQSRMLFMPLSKPRYQRMVCIARMMAAKPGRRSTAVKI